MPFMVGNLSIYQLMPDGFPYMVVMSIVHNSVIPVISFFSCASVCASDARIQTTILTIEPCTVAHTNINIACGNVFQYLELRQDYYLESQSH